MAETTTSDAAKIKELERENRELKRANEILLAASSFFARELDPRLPLVEAFIDGDRTRFGVEPMCRVLTEHGVAPSTYDAAKTRPRQPG